LRFGVWTAAEVHVQSDVEYITSRLSNRFWKLIELSRTDWAGFEQALSQLEVRDRTKLLWTYEAALNVLRSPEYEDYVNPGLVEDGLHELATWIVAQGRTFYMDIIEHPEHMPSDAPDPPFATGSPYGAIIRAAPTGLGPPEDDDYFFR
jgi:hypothetical protein